MLNFLLTKFRHMHTQICCKFLPKEQLILDLSQNSKERISGEIYSYFRGFLKVYFRGFLGREVAFREIYLISGLLSRFYFSFFMKFTNVLLGL